MLDLQIIRKHNIFGRRRYGTTEDHRRFETHGMAEHIMRRIRDLYGDRELVSMSPRVIQYWNGSLSHSCG